MKSFRWTLLAVTAIACGLALTISVSAGERPEAVSPGNGSGTVIAGACPSFSWGAVAGATSYELVTYQVPEGLSAKASPSDLKELWRVTVPGSARSWTPPANRCFSHGGSYAWAVRAVVDGQPGTWSEANLFTIEKAPSAEEVRGTIAELRRYLVVSRTRRAGTRGAESKLRTRSSATPRATPTALRARMADGGIRRAAGAAERAGGLHSLKSASGTPSLGTPSLTIDSSLSLGSSSSVFKNGKVFLWDDTVGNLALGDSALASVSSYASENTAVGQDALRNTAGNAVSFVYGSFNTASGFEALYHNTTGFDNTASGWEALYRNTTGAFNTVSGYEALYFNTTGSGNIAIGTFAGYAAGYGGASDNYDIFIGNLGYASDSGVTRIGDFHQKSAFIAGIDGVNVGSSGTTVLINSSGQLGTSTSSRRFKQGIENMGDVTDKLYELRPVIFRYKQWVREAIKEGKDPAKLPHSYGLIAEEVAKVFPDLVVYGKDGKPEAVKYRLLAPMLLNELQKEHWKVIGQAEEIARAKSTNVAQQAELQGQGKELAELRDRDSAVQRELASEVTGLKNELAKLETRLAAREPSVPKAAAEAQRVASKLQR